MHCGLVKLALSFETEYDEATVFSYYENSSIFIG